MRLDGVRVLDLTRLLPGPYASQLLADAGADVVKIEDTGAGDYARQMPPTTEDGHGAVFDAVNRGKRSVALDLKSEDGRELFYRLVEDADVVFEQFRPGVVDRLGVDYESVREYNPEIIYCSLSGYGQNGPKADEAGHDINYVGLGGLLDMSRDDEDEKPQPPGYQVADLGGGLFAAFSIVAALASRELGNTGGEYIDVGMTDVVVSFSQAVAPGVFAGNDPRPGETPLTGAYPWYDVYECADGRYVTIGALEPQFWRAFCEAVDRPEWADRHMTGDPAERRALREAMADLFRERTRDEWADIFDGVDAMVEGVYTPAEALDHPQVRERGYVERPDGALPRVGFPARGTEIDRGENVAVPDHGGDTDAVLGEVGVDDSEIRRLRDEGVVA
jgi:crotonobetainyl-CoA:carnitine CoA-transferase CaiB-like acyl-CoA transferase